MMNVKSKFKNSFAIIFLALIAMPILAGCSDTNGHYEHDPEFILNAVNQSPDKKHRIVEYQFDHGAFGESRIFWAVVPAIIDDSDLTRYLLPDGYKGIGWTHKNELMVQKWEPNYYKEQVVNLRSGDVFKNVPIIILSENTIQDSGLHN